MDKLTNYGRLCAEVYDVTKPVGENYPDVPYHIQNLHGIDGRVLEAGVGTGRLIIPLLQAGFVVDGIDSSAAMLDVCRHNCETLGLNPTLYHGKLETMALPERYQAIIISYGSFMLLESKEGAAAALQSFHSHLLPGGRLFLDVDKPMLPYDSSAAIVRRNEPIQCPDGSSIMTEWTAYQYSDPHLTVGYGRYERFRDGILVETELQRMPIRRYEREEMELLLKENGFADLIVNLNYTFGLEADDEPGCLCFAATRAGA